MFPGTHGKRAVMALSVLFCICTTLAWTGVRAANAGGCAAPTVDGNINDLLVYAGCVTGCGLQTATNAGDVCKTNNLIVSCSAQVACASGGGSTYFVNGFDLTEAALAWDRTTNTLFLGYRVAGTIGDTDGNGNPNTAGGASCAPGANIIDQSGIGTQESYLFDIDTNCDQIPDVEVRVTGSQASPVVSILDANGDPVVGATGTAAYAGSDLEVRVTGLSLPPVFEFFGTAGSAPDGLSEDRFGPLRCTPPALSIDIQKSATPVRLCPGATTAVTLTVHNTSEAALNNVTVTDLLPANLSYVASSTGGTCGVGEPTIGGQLLTWNVGDLAIDQSCTITFTAARGAECLGTVTNHAEARGTFQTACLNGGAPIDVGPDAADFDLVCVDAPCVTLDLTCSPEAACAGEPVTLDWTITSCSDSEEQVDVVIDGQSFGPFTLAPGGTQTGTKSATMPVDCPPPGTVPFSGTATASNECPAGPEATSTDECSVTCLPPPSVTCSATPNPTSACPGASIVITGTATNNSGGPENIDLTIAGTLYSFTDVADGTTVSRDTTVIMPDCTDGQNVTFDVTAVATNSCPGTRDDCTATATVECQAPEITVTKTADPADGTSGELQGTTIHYTIEVNNPSSDVTLENITVTDNFDELYGGNANPTPDSEPAVGANGGTVVWTLATLAPGTTQTFTFDVTVENRNPCVARDVVNQVTAAGSCADANTDDTAETTHHVTCPEVGSLCRITGGGCLNEKGGRAGHKQNTFGGNVSPAHTGGGPTGNEWEHVLRDGRTVLFNFHSHDAHITLCDVVPPGPCSPDAINTRAFFEGTGTYSLGAGSRTQDANFSAWIIDHKEGSCNRSNRDEYSITVRKGLVQGSGDVVFTITGEIDCGNLQIHETPARIFGVGADPGIDPEPAVGSPSEVSGNLDMLNRVIPNPFSGTMSYSYRVPQGTDQVVDISVYDMAGRLVRTLVSDRQAAGQYTVKWDSRNNAGVQMAPGAYLLRARVAGVQNVNRVILLNR